METELLLVETFEKTVLIQLSSSFGFEFEPNQERGVVGILYQLLTLGAPDSGVSAIIVNLVSISMRHPRKAGSEKILEVVI